MAKQQLRLTVTLVSNGHNFICSGTILVRIMHWQNILLSSAKKELDAIPALVAVFYCSKKISPAQHLTPYPPPHAHTHTHTHPPPPPPPPPPAPTHMHEQLYVYTCACTVKQTITHLRPTFTVVFFCVFSLMFSSRPLSVSSFICQQKVSATLTTWCNSNSAAKIIQSQQLDHLTNQ